jgi:hypothetical protein
VTSKEKMARKGEKAKACGAEGRFQMTVIPIVFHHIRTMPDQGILTEGEGILQFNFLHY